MTFFRLLVVLVFSPSPISFRCLVWLAIYLLVFLCSYVMFVFVASSLNLFLSGKFWQTWILILFRPKLIFHKYIIVQRRLKTKTPTLHDWRATLPSYPTTPHLTFYIWKAKPGITKWECKWRLLFTSHFMYLSVVVFNNPISKKSNGCFSLLVFLELLWAPRLMRSTELYVLNWMASVSLYWINLSF